MEQVIVQTVKTTDDVISKLKCSGIESGFYHNAPFCNDATKYLFFSTNDGQYNCFAVVSYYEFGVKGRFNCKMIHPNIHYCLEWIQTNSTYEKRGLATCLLKAITSICKCFVAQCHKSNYPFFINRGGILLGKNFLDKEKVYFLFGSRH